MVKDKLIIIRHARSEHNISKTENLDSGISEYGRSQALNVGSFLSDLNLSGFLIYTSPFLRCLETTDLICSKFSKSYFNDNDDWFVPMRINRPVPVIVPELREYLNHTGKFINIINRKSEFKFNWDDFNDKEELYSEEVNEVFLERMHFVYNKLPAKSIVITHGLPALTLLQIATQNNVCSVPIWDHSIDNCSITAVSNGRLVWRGRNLYHEHEYDSKLYSRDWDKI